MRFIKCDYIKDIIIVFMVAIIICSIIHSSNSYNELKELNDSLGVTINNQAITIEQLKEENFDIKNYTDSLEQENKALKQENVSLSFGSQSNANDFKSYMSYMAITDRSSKQWELQQLAYTDTNGIRCVDGRPAIAVGTGWGLVVGDVALVTCSNGNSFEVIIGDIKADVHTLSDNKTGIANGCRCEFIVDTSTLNKTVKIMGNVAVLEEYSGYVVGITKI